MEDGTACFEDWEILPPESATLAEAEGLVMLRLDYFSINDDDDKMRKYGDEISELSSEGGGSAVSDKPCWIDSAMFPFRNSDEFWPDSVRDQCKSGDSEDNLGLGFMEKSGESSVRAESEGVHLVENMSVVADNSEEMEVAESPSRVENCVALEAAEDGEIEKEVDRSGNVEKKALLWWKLPLELVNYCVFRISPLWSISVAAAMLGVFIVRRRLHMMKKKTKSLQMKVTMDDNKVDQFMSRAARLNEAFSVVRRVPIVRPSLPAPGVTIWPVVSMR